MWATRKAVWWELTELTRLIFCRPVAVCFYVRLFIVLFFFFFLLLFSKACALQVTERQFS